ncbi:MAG: baseplate J/gp47 family protein [Oscillospiraceae bacterium]|nr:baseplate J/gp47 family protein [Oscillospiraceae bacterium]
MLENITLSDKSYKDILDRAISLIPILSKDWTDYNDSDPGITILQLLSVLSLVQQSYVDIVNDKIKENLLKLLGYVREPVRAATVISAITTSKNQVLPKNIKFLSAEKLTFESRDDCFVTENKITKVATINDEKINDVTDIVCNGATDNYSHIFEPQAVRRELYISFAKSIPLNEFISLYAEFVGSKEEDVFFDFKTNICNVVWEYFSADGWKNLCIDDGTFAFSKSGILRFKLDQNMGKYEFDEKKTGFYIRARITDGEFNMAPKCSRLLLNVVQLFGQETGAKSVQFISNGEEKQVFNLPAAFSLDKKLLVLCEEHENLRLYLESKLHTSKNGRYYTMQQSERTLQLSFNKKIFGCGPEPGKQIKVIAYSKRLATSFNLGKVIGFDEQKIPFELTDVAESGLAFMLKTEDENGIKFVPCHHANNCAKDEDLAYSLDYDNNLIILHNNSCCSGELIITACNFCKGKNCNIKTGELLVAKNGEETIEARSITYARGGKDRENLADFTNRVVLDMEATEVALTKADYLQLLQNVPGIDIEKINIILDNKRNKIIVVIKLISDFEMPKLSSRHKEILGNHIEEHRQLTANVCFTSPSYVAIDVAGHIYIKPEISNAREIIYNTLKFELDSINSEFGFGKGVIYGEIYPKLEKLPCVEYIESLTFSSQSAFAKKDENGNLALEPFALGYLGDFQIVTSNKILTVV